MPTKDELEKELQSKENYLQELEAKVALQEGNQQDLEAQLLEREQTIADFQAILVDVKAQLKELQDAAMGPDPEIHAADVVEAQQAEDPEEPEAPQLPQGRRIVHIATGQPYGQGLTLFALDDEADVWQMIIGREPWTLLDGLPGSHS